ncbi:MAG: hypothetical protein WAZ27_04970 [Minisyncoccia bacterium]
MKLYLKVTKPRNWPSAFYLTCALLLIVLGLAVAFLMSSDMDANAWRDKWTTVVLVEVLAAFLLFFAALAWNERP